MNPLARLRGKGPRWRSGCQAGRRGSQSSPRRPGAIVHQSEEGLRVVMGHRRTLAAGEAKLSEIPELLADTVEEADRLAQQVSENDLREGLTDAERGTAFEQMALRGVTPAQIAKRAGAGDAETVKRALAAKKDPKAAEALWSREKKGKLRLAHRRPATSSLEPDHS
ncbi:ParB/RepB/Spo0J family partition protein [Arthrobacter sp. RCC_34]|uniref:ParB/RepB/Spo0J family partition protein n=1 Tax=Arthrobacter sp. RCC_34 TaxID=3239230 RepID=UPI0035250E17